MTISGRKTKLHTILLFCLLIWGGFSCTRDYFVDENNFYIYVPQIKQRSIENFYIALHSDGGRHFVSRFVERSEFESDTMLRQGLLRFKLPAGVNITATCYADLPARECVSFGQTYTDSHVSLLPDREGAGLAPARDFRALTSSFSILPIGHPQSQDRHTVNMTEELLHKARITLAFKNMPSSVAAVHAYYTGLGCCLHFDGSVQKHDEAPRIHAAHALSDGVQDGEYLSFSDMHYPSTGSDIFSEEQLHAALREELGVTFEFRDADGRSMGKVSVSEEDFREQLPDFSPRYLNPRQHITLRFDQFVLVDMELSEWGDIDQGETTPM